MSEVSVIHDIGYQRYGGARLGRWYAVRSLYLHGLRTAFGLGRSAKAKIFPWIVVGIVLLVAVIVTAVRSQIGQVVLAYLDVPTSLSALIFIFLAIVAPELVSRDLRSGVLPLYFARPIRRTDYALAKLAALISAAWLLLAAPMLVMFAGASFGAKHLRDVWTEAKDLGPGLAYAAVVVVVFGVLALLVASLTGKRAFAAGGIVAVFLVTTPVVGVLDFVGGDTVKRLSGLASPPTLVLGLQRWLFRNNPASEIGEYGPVYGLTAAALVCLCVLLLLVRYERVAR